MADPVSVMVAISAGLKLVDQFREVALRFKGQRATPAGATAELDGETFQIKYTNHAEGRVEVVDEVKADELRLDQWDAPEYAALQRRILTQWQVYQELNAEEVLLAADERARIKVRMGQIHDNLCVDFRSMVALYERALGKRLPDHYRLYEVCGTP